MLEEIEREYEAAASAKASGKYCKKPLLLFMSCFHLLASFGLRQLLHVLSQQQLQRVHQP